MPVIEPTIEPKKRPRKRGRSLVYFLIVCLTLANSILLAGGLFIQRRLEHLPTVEAQYLQTYEPSRILDANGDVIWQPSEYRASVINYADIPTFYRDAIVAVEDATFWESSGISISGIANMIFGTIYARFDDTYVARGGSTIDQQLIKNRFYAGGVGYETTTRKIQEIFLAQQLNENFTKEEILTYYVNGLEFAEGSTGIKAIMKTYFNKKPSDYSERSIENIAEQAYLAGLSQAPSTYNLYDNPEAATRRMQVVLSVLWEAELISESEYNQACAYDLTTNLQPRFWEGQAQHQQNMKYKVYTDAVRQDIAARGYDIGEVSMNIYTFLDPATFDAITDMVRDPKYYLDNKQQMAVTVIDSDGIVVGMVGARESDDEWNRAIQTTRSSGSALKPFTAYAPLLQYFGDTYNSASTFDTSSYRYPGSSSIMYNYGKYTYGQQTMTQSLRLSLNTPVGRIVDNILGSSRLKYFLRGVGLDVKESYSSVDAIGLNVSTLQSAAAYNALNNLGTYTEPRFVDRIVFADGSIRTIAPTQTRAMNESVAWIINHILRGIPKSGMTADGAIINGYDGYAGKTGTVAFDASINAPAPYGLGGSDAWYNSITNDGFAISVWTGYDTPNTSPQIPDTYKKHQALNADLQQFLLGNKKPATWEQPDTVQHVSGSGLNAHYRVSDSVDVLTNVPTWANLDQYFETTIDTIISDNTVPLDWEADEDRTWLQYYQNGGESLPPVVDENIYNHMKDE